MMYSKNLQNRLRVLSKKLYTSLKLERNFVFLYELLVRKNVPIYIIKLERQKEKERENSVL